MSEDVALQAAALRLAIRLDCEHERLSLAELVERAYSRLGGSPGSNAASDFDVATDLQEELNSARYKIEDLEDDLDGWRDAAWTLANDRARREAAAREAAARRLPLLLQAVGS